MIGWLRTKASRKESVIIWVRPSGVDREVAFAATWDGRQLRVYVDGKPYQGDAPMLILPGSLAPFHGEPRGK